MQKKTRQSSNNSLTVSYCIAVAACMLGALISLYLFFTNYFRSYTKLDEVPIATISFKYKSAQRKFLNQVVWTRLRQDSPVYNGDTIHTSALSEATLHFSDGNIMELSENTMAQVFIKDDQSASVELSEGSALIDSTASANGMSLSSGGVSVAVQAGASVSTSRSASEKNGGIALQVLEGNATVGGQSYATGQTVSLAQNGTESQVPLVVTAPLPDAKILQHSGNLASVSFIWSAPGLSADEELVLEFFSDKKMQSVQHKLSADGRSALIAQLPEGTWWWKLHAVDRRTGANSAGGAAQSGKLKVISSLPPEAVAPAQGTKYTYRSAPPSVRLVWTESKSATSYQLDIADNPYMANPVISQRSSLTSSIISTLESGTWYWRVTPFYTINRAGLEAPSDVHSFTIEKTVSLDAPKPLLPLQNAKVQRTAQDILFSWKPDSEAAQYTLRISKSADLSLPSVVSRTQDNHLSLGMEEAGLSEGQWYWNVMLTDAAGNESPVSKTRAFQIVEKKAEEKESVAPPQTALTPPEAKNETAPKAPVADTSLSAKNLRATPSHVDAAYLLDASHDKTIVLSWDSVPGATRYTVTVTTEQKKTLLSENVMPAGGGTERYVIDLLNAPAELRMALMNGTFLWTVGTTKTDDGTGTRRGTSETAVFTTSISQPQKVQVSEDAENPYGR